MKREGDYNDTGTQSRLYEIWGFYAPVATKRQCEGIILWTVVLDQRMSLIPQSQLYAELLTSVVLGG